MGSGNPNNQKKFFGCDIVNKQGEILSENKYTGGTMNKKSTGKKNARQVSNSLWLEKARQYAVKYAKAHTFVTADDVVAEVGSPTGHMNASGSLFKGGQFTKVGEVASRRTASHGKPIGIWRLAS